MNAKINTPTVWKGEPHGAGSVIEIDSDTFEKNREWMTATDEPVNKVEPGKPPTKGDKKITISEE